MKIPLDLIPWLQSCNNILQQQSQSHKLTHNKPGTKYTKIYIAQFKPNQPIHIPNTRFIWAFIHNQSGNIHPPQNSYQPKPTPIANIKDQNRDYVHTSLEGGNIP